jgi:hypothetical protein
MSEILAVVAVCWCSIWITGVIGEAGNELQRLQNDAALKNAEIQAMVVIPQNEL